MVARTHSHHRRSERQAGKPNGHSGKAPAAVQRRQTAHARAREEIFNAAARVFVRSGFSATTMQSIAAEAGYGTASLYTYFKSKEKILEGLVEFLTDEFLRVYDEPPVSGASFQQSVELLVYRLFKVAFERRQTLLVFLSVGVLPPALPRGNRENSRARGRRLLIQRLEDWFGQMAPPELLERVAVRDLAAAFTGLTQAFFQRTLEFPADPWEPLPGLIADLLLNGVNGADRHG